jgi:signal transduction histidine kinase
MHNGAAVLRLLTEPDLPAGVRAALVDQGLAELHQMRAYLHPPSAEADVAADGTIPLVDLLERTCARFTDLRIERNTGLGADVVVAEEDARAIARAVDSALLNVREHAHADLVVLHLGRTGDTWTLTIHDDGTGFDPRTVTFGVGLREVVTGELGRHGLGVVIDSAPGEGTTVSVSGRVPAASPGVAGTAFGEARAAGRAGW